MPESTEQPVDLANEVKVQAGTVSAYLEISFPRLTPDSLRAELVKSFKSKVDGVASATTRKGWLGASFPGPMSSSAALKIASDSLLKAGSQYSATSESQMDYYCRPEVEVICYFSFQVLENGSPILCTAEADGREIECPLLMVVKYSPA